MKIAHVVCVLPPYGGGIGIAAHSYADQLSELGHDVTVFVPKTNQPITDVRRYKIVQLRPWLKIGLGAVLPQLLWKLWNFDIVHLHYPFYGAAHFCIALKRLHPKIKLVLTYHMDTKASGFKGAIFNFHKNYITPFALKTADKIVVSSEDYIENSDISEYYFKNINKFVELPFGVPRRFAPSAKDENLLKKFNFEIDDKIVLLVGGLDSQHYFKGVNYLIKAFDFIENTKIKALVVGTGNLQKHYEEQTKEKGLLNRVKFSGFVSFEDLPKYYNLCDVFILPSINSSEAFGIVLLEAMSSGKPLIASNLKGVRTVVQQGQNGVLVEPKNSRDIAEKIKYILENPALAESFSKRGLQLVDEKYRWSIIVKKLEKIYENLLNK